METSENMILDKCFNKLVLQSDSNISIEQLQRFLTDSSVKGHDTAYIRQGRKQYDNTEESVLITYSKSSCMNRVQRVKQELEAQGKGDCIVQYFIESGDIKITPQLVKGYVKASGDAVLFADDAVYEDQADFTEAAEHIVNQ